MTTIASLLVTLGLDPRGMTAGTAQAQGSMAKLSAGAQKMGISVGVAAVAAGAAVVKFATDAVGAAIEANQAHLKLTNTFQNNILLADSSVEAFEAQADALRDLTGVDDEAIASSQALLGQFDLLGSQVLELTPLIVDLSEKLGIDLAAAAKAVGKAATGNTGALARYIGAIEKGATPAETYANVLEKLGRVQGFAAAQADEEPWRLLEARFEEVQERAGKGLLPVLIGLSETLVGLGTPALTLSDDVARMALNLDGFREAAEEAAKPNISDFFSDVATNVRGLIVKFQNAQKAAGNFADMTDKEFHAFKDAAVSSIQDVVGSLTGFDRKWGLTANAAARAMEGMVAKSREMARDFKKLDTSAIPDKFEAWLIQQGPDAVHAFVDMSQRQQDRFVGNWKKTNANVQAAVDSLPDKLRTAGQQSGSSFGLGLVGGMGSMEPRVAAAAHNLAQEAVDAANATLGISSPSKVAHEMGINFMAGFAGGLRDGLSDVISTLRDVIGDGISKAKLLQAKELEALADDLTDRLERLRDRISSFRDDIRSAFDIDLVSGLMGLEELTAVNASAFLTDQLAQAQAFAQALEDLQAAGLGQAGLAELAGQGIEALPLAQLLLGSPDLLAQFDATQGALADLASSTLVDEVFGDAVEKASARLADLEDRIEQFVKSLDRIDLPDKFADLGEALTDLLNLLDRGNEQGGGRDAGSRVRSPAMAALASGGMAGQASTVVNITVQGSIWETDNLAGAIDEALYRNKRRGGLLTHHQGPPG